MHDEEQEECWEMTTENKNGSKENKGDKFSK